MTDPITYHLTDKQWMEQMAAMKNLRDKQWIAAVEKLNVDNDILKKIKNMPDDRYAEGYRNAVMDFSYRIQEAFEGLMTDESMVKLYEYCKKWIKEHDVIAPESIWQREDIAEPETLMDFLQGVCKIVGYSSEGEETK